MTATTAARLESMGFKVIHTAGTFRLYTAWGVLFTTLTGEAELERFAASRSTFMKSRPSLFRAVCR